MARHANAALVLLPKNDQLAAWKSQAIIIVVKVSIKQ